MNAHYRQGDVMLIRVDSVPPKAIPEQNDDRIVLAYGEVTGHAHAINIAYAEAYEWEGERFLQVKSGATLVHEEHAPIVLEAGAYRIVRQREYSPYKNRYVYD